MSKRFEDWKAAHTYAVLFAREIGRDVGISKTVEYGKTGFNVHSLPRPENRHGFELRAEVVRPTDPL